MTEKPVEGNELDRNWSNEYCHQEYIKFLLHMESSLEHNDTMLSKHPDIDEGKDLLLNLSCILFCSSSAIPGTNWDTDRLRTTRLVPRTPDRDIENMDEVLEKTRKAHATFIPENKTENHLKTSLNLANSLDHVAIESTDIDSVRKVISIYIKVHFRVRVPWTGLGPIFHHREGLTADDETRTMNLGRMNLGR